VKLALLHAFPLDERMWEPQRKALDGQEVIAPHLYRLGKSMDEWARRVAEQAERPIVAVGASMGGYCAQRLLVHADVRALVLAGSRADGDSPDRREARAETLRLVGEEGVERLWEAQRPGLFPDSADERAVERARALALEQDPEELANGVTAMRDRPDSTSLVRETEAPVLVAVGEHDPFFTQAEAEALASSARDGRAHVFPRCGHLPSLERPDEFNRVLIDFLNAHGL
jgi:pimeloyl-ACP methyl ester carboxylesterase